MEAQGNPNRESRSGFSRNFWFPAHSFLVFLFPAGWSEDTWSGRIPPLFAGALGYGPGCWSLRSLNYRNTSLLHHPALGTNIKVRFLLSTFWLRLVLRSVIISPDICLHDTIAWVIQDRITESTFPDFLGHYLFYVFANGVGEGVLSHIFR